jgi:hypothetical protein
MIFFDWKTQITTRAYALAVSCALRGDHMVVASAHGGHGSSG